MALLQHSESEDEEGNVELVEAVSQETVNQEVVNQEAGPSMLVKTERVRTWLMLQILWLFFSANILRIARGHDDSR